MARLSANEDGSKPKRARVLTQPTLGFSDEDKTGTIQPYDDALVVTLRIGGYDVRRVLVDQSSVVGIMYPDLYKGLNLKPKDLTAYESPLVSFEGKTVIPIRNKDILRKIVGICGTIWTNLSERAN